MNLLFCFHRFILLLALLLDTFVVGDVTSALSSAETRTRPWYRCPRRCACGFGQVNCNGRGLTAIPPDIPDQTRFLYLQFNKITTLGTSWTFNNSRHLQVLDLSHNQITTLEDSIFCLLGHLLVLDLSFNSINATGSQVFVGLSQLTELHLSGTGIAFVPEAFLNLTNLRTFAFERNRLVTFPQFLFRGKSLFPKLLKLNLNNNNLESINSSGLDSIQFLSVASNKIKDVDSYTMSRFRRLRRLDLRENHLRYVDSKAFCSTTLRRLNLAESRYTLTSAERNFFTCIPNLERLSLVNVRVLGGFRPFSNLTKLKKLNLRGTGVNYEIAIKILADLKQLVWLSLNHNPIQSLSRELFQNFSSTLKYLSLRNNRITTLNITSLPDQLWMTLDMLDVSDNPFTCDCQLVWFLRWLSTTNVTIPNHKFIKYECNAPATMRKKALMEVKRYLEVECFKEPIDWYTLVIFLLSVAVSVSSTIGSVLYRFRWYAKYWYFKYKIQQRQEALSSDNDRSYQYDAFVSYSKSDTRWVVTELRRHLETEEGLQLCIHDRDFQVGEDIVSNVIRSIERSRKVLFIVSNAFVASQWCHFELVMVQTRMLEKDRDNLILILLEELDAANLSPRLKLQMERQTYLEWTESWIGRQLFWDRLRQAVRRAPESVVNSHLPIELFQSGSS